MSQHLFSTSHKEKPITVVIGWDRPLRYHFMYIENDDAIEESNAFLYHNMDDEKSINQPLAYYEQVLKDHAITVPASMIEESREDAENNAGNRRCLHTTKGFESMF